jgi:hypothetical protein
MKMRLILRGTVILGLLGATAIGCSRFQKEQRAEWRSQAEKACIRSGAVKESQFVKIVRSLEGPGSCGADYPIKVSAFTVDAPQLSAQSSGLFGIKMFQGSAPKMQTRLNNEGTLTCPMYVGLNRWLEQVVQPAAMARFGQPVVEIRTMGTYSCRRMNNGSGTARFSEHAFANAVDIGGFKLQDGTVVTVLRGWKGGLEEQNFLREVHAGACRNFATVLGPGADAFHYDHFHFDLAKHGRRGDRSICRPYPQPVTPPNQTVPNDPGRGGMMAYGTPQQQQPRTQVAQPLPNFEPSRLPAAPRNPNAEVERREIARPSRPVGDPILLYGRGKGPFTPLPEHEIDPEDLDPVTGSIGE